MFETVLPSLLLLAAIVLAPFMIRYLVNQRRGHIQLSRRGAEGLKLYVLVLASLGFQVTTIGVSLMLLGVTDGSILMGKMGFGLTAGGLVMLYLPLLSYPRDEAQPSRLKQLWSTKDPRISGARRINGIMVGLIFLLSAAGTATSILMLGSPAYALLPALTYGAAWTLCAWPRWAQSA